MPERGHEEPPPPVRRSNYPVNLIVDGVPVLVVGGGSVAARKIRGLLRAGAMVSVVAPDVVGEIDQLATEGPVRIERRTYRSGEARDHHLVITATGVGAVDTAVADDAREAGIWVNSADDPDNCTFILPAIHRDGDVTISVSTSGTSPALATWLKGRIADMVGNDLGAMAALLEGARQRVKAEGRSTESVAWQALLAGPWPDLVASGRLDEAQDLVDRLIE